MIEWKRLIEQTQHKSPASTQTTQKRSSTPAGKPHNEKPNNKKPYNEMDNSPSLKQKKLPFSTEDQQSRWISSTEQLKNQIQNIPDRMGFKIGEVARQLGVKQYVLRYWESEFNGFHPKKSENGQRIYTKKDMETAFLIKKLLHEDRFSIEGAKSALNKLRKQVKYSTEKPKLPDQSQKSFQNQNNNNNNNNNTIKIKNLEKVSSQDQKKTSLDFACKLLDQIRQAKESLKL